LKIYLDNIIFSLQSAGGISVYWFELVKRILKDPEFAASFIESPSNNMFRNRLEITPEMILRTPTDSFPIKIQRYLNPGTTQAKGIFHSSYYRVHRNPGMMNVTSVHDFTYEYFRSGLAKTVHQWQKGNAIKKAKRIICVSENTKMDLLKFYPEISEKSISVVYNGVDEVYAPLDVKDESKLKEIIPFSSGEFVLFIGDRKSRHKNFAALTEACKISKKPLLMVGGGKLSQLENEFLVRTLGNLHFKQMGGIDNDLLNRIYNHALCMVYPSLYEGFGIPVVEAQKAGCPVISAFCSSIPEVAGQGAILINNISALKIAEAISQLDSDSSLVGNLRSAGFVNAQRFSWDKCYLQTKDVYKEIGQ